MFDDMLAQAVSLGNYVAIWKLVVFTILFVLWAWVGQWINRDAKYVATKQEFWCNVYMGLGTVVWLSWFVLPAPFLVPLILQIVVWLTVTIIYVLHRNTRVHDDEKILTPDHIKSLFAREGKKREIKARLFFISAHGNELPPPSRDASEYRGFTIAEDIIYDAWLHRAMKADLRPAGENVELYFIIDGVANKLDDRPREDIDEAIAYLKAVADLDVQDRRKPQSGGFSISVDGDRVDWRLETAGSTRGERLVLEQIEEVQTLGIDDLGFNEDQLAQMKQTVAQRSGVVVVCAPPRMGLTTTLYSMVRCHDAFTQNINSLEMDPLLDLDNITQHDLEKGATPELAAKRLQSVIRGDPDVVLLDLCRSGESAQSLTRAARDGKKLYTGMAQPSTFHALQEWIKMVGKRDRIAETLLAITSQRLVRKLCPECREAYAPDPTMLRKLNLPADKIKQFYRPPQEIEYDKKGNPILCENCQGTGYFGRTAVFETLFLTDGLRQMITGNAPINDIKSQCRKERMLYLQEQAIRKVIDGETSIQEVLRVTTERRANAKRPANNKEAPQKKGG